MTTSTSILGRESELAAMRAAVDDALAERGRLLLVVGEPGIGKTTLADAIAAHAATRGIVVAWGRCWEAGGAPAFWPLTQACESLLERVPLDDARAALAHAGADVLRLVPSWSERASMHAPGAVDAESARFAAGRALTALLSHLSRRAPLALVLDDLHAADLASLHALRFLARDLREQRVLVVATLRDAEARLSDEVGAVLAAIAREGVTLPLGRLDASQSSALVRRAAGEVPPDVDAAIFAATQGNPLFIDEVARLIAQQRRVEPNAGGARPGAARTPRVPIPVGVREVVRQRIALVDADARAALEVAAVAGDDVRVDVVAAMCGAAAADVADALARAARAGVLNNDGRRFAHALFREVLVRDLPQSRRATLHKAAADALARLPVKPLVLLAHHLVAAGAAHVAEAVAAVEEAQASLVQSGAYDDAVDLVEHARDALAFDAGGALACRLLVAHGDALVAAGRVREGKELCAKASSDAATLGDGELMALAALAFGGSWSFGFAQPELIAMLESARLALSNRSGHDALLARVEARLAGAQQPAHDFRQPIALARHAIERARKTGDAHAVLDALHTGMSALMDYEHPRDRTALNLELLERATAARDRAKVLRAHVRLAFDNAELGDFAAVDAQIDRYALIAEEIGHPQHLYVVPLLRSMLAVVRGAHDDHLRCFADARAIAARASPELGAVTLAMHGMASGFVRDDRDEIMRELPRIDAVFQTTVDPAAHAFRALIAHAVGDDETMRARLATLPRDLAARAPGDALFAAPILAVVGDVAMAADLYDGLALRRGTFASIGSVAFAIMAPLDQLLGDCARAVGRVDDARACYEAALALCERTGAAGFTPALRARLTAMPGTTAAATTTAVSARATTAATAPAARLVPSGVVFALVDDGDVWRIDGPAGSFRLKDSRGLHILKALVDKPGVEVHALDLMERAPGAIDGGDAGALLDDDAKRDYRERMRALKADIDEADADNDRGRADKLRAEQEALERELARGLGLGGRPRRAGAAAERARVAVQRRVKDAIEKIREKDPALGAHLAWAVKTGSACVYRP